MVNSGFLQSSPFSWNLLSDLPLRWHVDLFLCLLSSIFALSQDARLWSIQQPALNTRVARNNRLFSAHSFFILSKVCVSHRLIGKVSESPFLVLEDPCANAWHTSSPWCWKSKRTFLIWSTSFSCCPKSTQLLFTWSIWQFYPLAIWIPLFTSFIQLTKWFIVLQSYTQSSETDSFNFKLNSS